MWTPDVYQGSDTIVTAFMATVAKVAFMAAFMRLFMTSFATLHNTYVPAINIIAMLTMLVGNLTALYQKDIKRMLAYSSIAHAGYMLLALSGANSLSNGAILMYSVAYGCASVIAFTVIIIVSKYNTDTTTESMNGLLKANPLLGAALIISMLSLAGIPITAGFFAKFYIFNSAIQAGYLWVVVFAVVNSAISIYYYFKPIINAAFKEGMLPPIKLNAVAVCLFIILSLVILVVGIYPDILMPAI
jgi:NADH-quinone oxidoreductase subunit N